MIIDPSAVLAILLDEPEKSMFATILSSARRKCIAAPGLLEASMVVAGKQKDGILDGLDRLIAAADIEVIAFTADHAAVARDAFLRYGKGRHRAALNFGDCISYATARLEAMPLLFKGDDFRLTDIEPAV